MLRQLYSYQNPLGVLDVSNNSDLTHLSCGENLLTEIDLSNNPQLTYLNCAGNAIQNLDISNNEEISYLYCQNNQIQILDASLQSSLTRIRCENNDLEVMDMANGNNYMVNNYNSIGNPNLICVNVDNPEYSNANWHNKDAQTQFSDACSAASLSTDKFLADNIMLFPNPFVNRVYITLEQSAKYSLFSVNGQKIEQGILQSGKNSFEWHKLSNGLYFLNIVSENSIVTFKLVKS